MKGFIIILTFTSRTLLYLGLATAASTVTDKQQINIICPGEQQTTLMCSTNHIFLEWNVSSLGQTETRSISSLDHQNPTIAPITMNSADFTFSRVSSPMALPLVTTMTIMNITSILEGTLISCSGLNRSSDSTIVLMTTVHVYNMDIDIPNAPDITLTPDVAHLGMDNFTVVLEWSQFSGETYTVAAVPEALHTSIMHMNTSCRAQLVLLYDTEYNVTITATLCGNSNSTNSTTQSYYYAKPQSTITSTSITTTYISTNSHQTTVKSLTHETLMIDSSLLGLLIGVCSIIVISLISIILVVIAVIFKKRGHKTIERKILYTSSADNSSKSQMTATQESETMHEMVHCEADQLVYADVFSASMVHPKPDNQTLKLNFDDDRVDYVEVSHSLTTDAHNLNPEIDSLLNLDNLLIHIKRDATQVWYQLGDALGIKKAILDKFTTCSPEEAIIEMLDYWLRSHTGKPTWKEVADALRKIHLHESASGIETLSKTGDLSVATDLNLELSHIPQELLREKESAAVDDQYDCECPPPVPPKGIMKIL